VWRTDRQTNRRTKLQWLKHATAVAAVARKNGVFFLTFYKTVQTIKCVSYCRKNEEENRKKYICKKEKCNADEILGFIAHLLRIPDVSEKPTFHGSISSSSVFSAMLGSCFGRRSPGSSRFWPVKSTRHTLFLLLFSQHNQWNLALSAGFTLFTKLSRFLSHTNGRWPAWFPCDSGDQAATVISVFCN